ncbi:MAG: hypothetical protein HN509_15145 [Halobacteriovoraceae bacterium]|jgi:hypothetical protein|nr:hypothetical protein [Halobacteriovoraceae bacterium]MBT5094479.1 hypothetical protein [Halobacteriovoraceae bacterium]
MKLLVLQLFLWSSIVTSALGQDNQPLKNGGLGMNINKDELEMMLKKMQKEGKISQKDLEKASGALQDFDQKDIDELQKKAMKGQHKKQRQGPSYSNQNTSTDQKRAQRKIKKMEKRLKEIRAGKGEMEMPSLDQIMEELKESNP